MTATPRTVTVTVLMRLLREAFRGPPGPWTYFSDTGPAAGLLATLDGLTNVEASEAGGPSGTTIAGHVYHVSASLSLSIKELGGEQTSRDRSASWTISTVDPDAWAALRDRLRHEYDEIMNAVQRRAEWDEGALGTAVGAIAHAAYHLGAIRQRVAVGSSPRG